MANPNAVVAQRVHVDAGPEELAERVRAEGGLWLTLDGERRVRLDPDDPRSPGLARVLQGLERERLPVYLELDPESQAIRRVLIPLVSPVGATYPTADGLAFELAASHARHLLRRDDPDFAEFDRVLGEAKRDGSALLVTVDEQHRVIDLRRYTPDPESPPPPFPEPLPLLVTALRPWWWRALVAVWWWPWWPWWWFWWWLRCVSPARAQQIFDAMAARSCDPLTVPPPCIPFLYPDDGCWARAHEMARLMIAMGVTPSKVWIRAATVLHVNTRNNPACFVEWGWHVAPTICVRGSFPFTQRMVIDPSLFTGPVPVATWKGVQNDPSASLTFTSWTQYWPQAGTTDPAYVDTNIRLAYYRLQLQNRSVAFGPPPYAACP